MSKRYVLLKDIVSPDLIAKAGDIGIKKDSLYYDENNQVFFDNGRYFFYLRTILQYPDWFKEITDTPPNPSNEEFIWTDELVWECLCSIPKDTLVTYKEHIIKFKQSKEKAKVNDGVSHTYNLNKGEIVSVEVGGVKYLSPEEVLEKEKKAFEAARGKDYFSTPLQESVINGFVYTTYKHKYPTFEDYKKAKP